MMGDDDDPIKKAQNMMKGAFDVKLAPVDEKEVDELVKQIMAGVTPKAAESGGGSGGAPEVSAKERAQNLSEAKENYAKGQRLAKQAVVADGEEKYGSAAKNYDECLQCFAISLRNGFPHSEDKVNFLVNTMLNYMDRVQALLLASETKNFTMTASTETIPAIGALNLKRRMVMKEMLASGNFQPLSRGVQLRKQAMAAEKEGNAWEAFVLYSEAVDCFVVYVQALGSDDAKKKKPVMDAIGKTLEAAEALKAQIREI